MKTSHSPPSRLVAPPAAAFAPFFGGGGTTTDADTDTTDATASSRRLSLASAVTYILILCLPGLSIVFVSSMNTNSAQMHAKVKTSTQLLTQSSLDTNREKELEDLAFADMHQAKYLSNQAKELATKGAEDLKKANADANEATSLENEAAQEQNEGKKLRTQADFDDRLYEIVKANATELSERANKDRMEADEATVPGAYWCQRPIFRRICNALGAATKIRSEEAAHRAVVEAKEAFDEYERAKTVREREEEEMKKAQQLEEQSKKDEEEAQELETAAKDEMNAGREEEKEAERDQVDADQDAEKGNKEADEAKSLETKAREENSRAAALREEATKHGQQAFAYGVLASIFATFTLIVFSIRFAAKFGVVLYWCVADYWTCLAHEQKCSPTHEVNVPEAAERTWTRIPKANCFRFLVECVGLLASVASFAGQWMHFEDYSTRTRGALVLVCALVAGMAQSIALFTLPALYDVVASLDMECDRLLEREAIRIITAETLSYFSLSLTISTILSIIFILILWINMGGTFASLSSYLNAPLMWLVFVLGSYVFFRCFHNKSDEALQTGGADDNSKSVSTITRENMSRNDDSKFVNEVSTCTERDGLLDRDWGLRIGDYEVIVAGSEGTSSVSDERIDALLDNSIRSSCNDSSDTKANARKNCGMVLKLVLDSLQFPFELLVLSCMIAILRTSVLKCHELSFTLHVASAAKLWYVWMFLSAPVILISYTTMRTWFIKRKDHQRNQV